MTEAWTDVPGTAPTLFDTPPPIDGETYDPVEDGPRLGPQLKRAYDFLAASEWVTIGELSRGIGCSETSASARIRDLRKEKFGRHDVRRMSLGRGLHVYRLFRPGEELHHCNSCREDEGRCCPCPECNHPKREG